MIQRGSSLFRFLSIGLLFPVLFPGGGCNKKSSDPGTGTAVVQVTDAAFQDLSSLRITITQVDLLDTDGTAVRVFPPDSQPGATVILDLVSLSSAQPIIAVDQVTVTSFDGARIGFQDVTATDLAGAAQAVTTTTNFLELAFADPVTVTRDAVNRLLLDFDGSASVVSTGPGSLTFSPVVFEISGEAIATASDVSGRVVSIGSDRFGLALNVGPAGNTQPPISSAQPFELGEMDVFVNSGTRFLVDGALFTGLAGLGLLVPNDQVNVSGRLINGGVRSDQMVVDRAGGLNPITVRGTVAPAGTLVVNRLVRDANGQLTVQPGGSIGFTTGPFTSFFRQSGTGSFSSEDLFPGQSVELIGSLSGGSLNASSLELRESTLAGSLSSFDFPQAGLMVNTINGHPVTSFPGAETPNLDLSSANNFIDGFVPTTSQTFAPNQIVTSRGTFTAADQFSSSMLSLNQSQDFVASGPFQASSVGRSVTGTVNGAPASVFLSPSTRFFQTQTSRPGSLSNSTASGFLGDVESNTGTINVRGFQSGSGIQATRVGTQIP